MSTAIVRQEAEKVLVVVDGKATELPWEAAIELGRALMAKGRLAEEHAKAEGIIYDNAILFRAGIPLGLSNHPAIRAETAKVAAWDSRLRRYLPGGIKSEEMVGTPAVIGGDRGRGRAHKVV